jgi:hypothetical protein
VKVALQLVSLACVGVNFWLIWRVGGWVTLGLCLACGTSAQFFLAVSRRLRA